MITSSIHFRRRAFGPAAFAGLERILRSMTLLAFLEHPMVVAAIGEERGEAS